MLYSARRSRDLWIAFNLIVILMAKLLLIIYTSDSLAESLQKLFFYPAMITIDVFLLSFISSSSIWLLGAHTFITASFLIQIVEFHGYYEFQMPSSFYFNLSLLKASLQILWKNSSLLMLILLMAAFSSKPIGNFIKLLSFKDFYKNLAFSAIAGHFAVYLTAMLLFQPNIYDDVGIILTFAFKALVSSPTSNSHSSVQTIKWKYPQKFIDEWIVNNAIEEKLVKTDSPFKHVVLIVGESVRDDFFPVYNYTISSARKKNQVLFTLDKLELLQGASSNEGLVTGPFTASLLRKQGHALSSTQHFSQSSYTLKSLISILCGYYPLNVNYNLETGFKLHHQCLPEMLGSQFETAFMQPSDIHFDNQINIIQDQMKFKTVIHKSAIKENYPDLQEANYFGYSDMDLIPFVRDYLDNLKDDQRMFLTIMTSVSHHRWSVPSEYSYLVDDYTTDKTVNDYLSTLRYTDKFLKMMFETIAKKKGDAFMKDTLFVFTGDHGVSMGDNLYGTIKNWKNSAISVPFLIYSDREWLSESLRTQRMRTQHVDIVPTLLDLLKVNPGLNSSIHGQSMVRKHYPAPVISTITPGNTYILVNEHDFKALFPPSLLFSCNSAQNLIAKCILYPSKCHEIKVFDLKNDPEEYENLFPTWQSYKSDKSINIRISIFEWTSKSFELAFNFVRRNRLLYGYNYE